MANYRWFWVAADGNTVVSLQHQLRGAELVRSKEEGWHRIYGDLEKYPEREEGVELPRNASGKLLSTANLAKEPQGVPESTAVRDEPGLPTDFLVKLAEDGIAPSDLAGISDEDLLAIPGVGPKKLEVIREHYPFEGDGSDEPEFPDDDGDDDVDDTDSMPF
jgi:hypothetical protein